MRTLSNFLQVLKFSFTCPWSQIADIEPLDMQITKLRLFIALEYRIHQAFHEFSSSGRGIFSHYG